LNEGVFDLSIFHLSRRAELAAWFLTPAAPRRPWGKNVAGRTDYLITVAGHVFFGGKTPESSYLFSHKGVQLNNSRPATPR
jgi:hypothetical protein